MWQVLICVVFALGMVCYSVFITGDDYGDAHMPMILAAAFTSAVAALNGWKWSVMEKGMLAGINRAMQANLILLTVGILVSTWKAGGVIPTMIYYGLDILNPSIFLVTAALLCSIVSLAIGSSYTVAGTIGVAMIGIAIGLGVNPAMAAGAVVSGGYFGDKMSPMSDTTNLAPAVSGSNIFDHIRHMVWTVTPSYIIFLVVMFILGMGHTGSAEMETADILQSEIQKEFTVSPLLLLPVLFLLLAIVIKIPALPAIFCGVLMGMFCMGVVQGIEFRDFFSIMHYGYIAESTAQLSEEYTVADVIGGGGFDGMLWTVSIVLCSMSFAGVLEATGMLGQLTEALMRFAKGTGRLVLTVILSCIVVNLLTADQYLSIILPGRMYKTVFEDRKLKAKNLSRCLEDSATLTSPLIPWNVCGTTMSGFLQVPTVQYAPYAVLNYVNPIVSIIYGFTGFTMEKMSDEEYEKVMEERRREQEEAMRDLEA